MAIEKSENMVDSLGQSPDPGYTQKKVRVVIRKANYRDVRCTDCNTLLARAAVSLLKSESKSVEIKCRKCGTLNHF